MTTTEVRDLHVRPASMADADALLAWRNDPVTRRMSLQTDEVPRDRHLRWLERTLASPDRVILIAADASSGESIGMCRFDVETGSGRRAEVSINLAPQQRGRGWGGALLAAGVAAFSAARPEVDTLTAVIRPANVASVRLFQVAGFELVAHDPDLLHYERRSVSAQQAP